MRKFIIAAAVLVTIAAASPPSAVQAGPLRTIGRVATAPARFVFRGVGKVRGAVRGSACGG